MTLVLLWVLFALLINGVLVCNALIHVEHTFHELLE